MDDFDSFKQAVWERYRETSGAETWCSAKGRWEVVIELPDTKEQLTAAFHGSRNGRESGECPLVSSPSDCLRCQLSAAGYIEEHFAPPLPAVTIEEFKQRAAAFADAELNLGAVTSTSVDRFVRYIVEGDLSARDLPIEMPDSKVESGNPS